jgi:hypothetical protein
MAHRTQESAIYGGPEDSVGGEAPVTRTFPPAVSIVPAPPLKAKTMVRSHALGLAILTLFVGLGLGLALGALLFS